MYAVRLADANGVERVYTGRAGRYFLSANKAEAFTYSTVDAARRKAAVLNRMIGGDFPFVAILLA